MIRSYYIAGTGMLVERSRMDTIGNNLTNVDTQGYKKDTAITRSFKDMLISRLNDASMSTNIGGQNTGVYVDEVITNFMQGSPEETNISTDMCIIGNAFFCVETPDGERYTRAGNFTLNRDGALVDNYGNFVLSDSGSHIVLHSDNFQVTGNGTVYDLDTNQNVANLKLVEFTDLGELRKEGANLFYDNGNAVPVASQNSTVMQRYLEGSNVNIAQEMVDMIISSRAYESNQRALRIIDETLQRTVNDIAKF